MDGWIGQLTCLLCFLMGEVYDSTTCMGYVTRTWLALALGRQETYRTRSSGPSIATGISGVRMIYILKMHLYQYSEVPSYMGMLRHTYPTQLAVEQKSGTHPLPNSRLQVIIKPQAMWGRDSIACSDLTPVSVATLRQRVTVN
jgi:hypothetical protein